RRRAASVEPELDGHAPALAGLAGGLRALGRLREVGEAPLAQDELMPLEPRADERIARLEDPAVHHVGDRLARCLAERRPQVTRVGVAVRVAADVLRAALADPGGPVGL